MTVLADYLAGLAGAERTEVATAMRSLTDKVVRGMAQGMRSSFSAFTGGSSWSAVTRSGHRSKKAFARARVVISTVYQPASPFFDVDLPNAYNFQCVIEPTFLEALTGLASSPKYQFLFGGNPTGAYAGPGSNPKGFIESDWLYFPLIAADQKFGLWTLVENQAGAASGNGTLPNDNQGGSSYLNRNEGNRVVASSQLGTLLTLDTVTAFSANQLGGSIAFTPAFLLIDYNVEDIVPAIDGDSITQGVGEGNTGSGAFDVLGSLKRNAGYAARGINETLGLNYAASIGKASDGGKFKRLAGAMRGRLALLRRANPTHIFHEDAVNDFGGAGINVVKTWAVYNQSSNFAYARGDVVTAGGNLYLCVRGGAPAASGSGPTGTTPFAEIADNTARWVYLMADAGANSPARTARAAYGAYLVMYDLYRAVLPGVKITKALATPVTTSTDGGLTQTLTHAKTTGARDLLHSLFLRQATDPTLGISAFFDPVSAVEYDDGSGTRSGMWATGADRTVAPASGAASYYSQDFTHPNGVGHAAIAAKMTPSLFAA